MSTPAKTSRFEFSTSEIAKIFSVTERSITNYRREGMPQVSRGVFDVRECVAWWSLRIEEHTERKTKPKGDTPRDQLARAQTERVLLDIEQLRRSLLPRVETERVLCGVAALVAAQLDGMAPRLAGVLADLDDPAEIQTVLFREARAVRAAIAQALRDLAENVTAGRLPGEDSED